MAPEPGPSRSSGINDLMSSSPEETATPARFESITHSDNGDSGPESTVRQSRPPDISTSTGTLGICSGY